jgi:hypothetical protein
VRRLGANRDHDGRYRGAAMTQTPAPFDGLAICSARGCRAPAVTVLVWRNPALHRGERVKRWVACDEHLDHLSDFLARRGFLLRIEPAPSAAGTADDGGAGS